MAIILALPPEIQELNQQGALERAFHDALYPNLAYRAEALAEAVQAQTGQTLFMSRPGLLPVAVSPLLPGADPTPVSVVYEQWVMTLNQYGSTIDTHMPTAVTSNANLFLRNIHQLGLQAGQSVNHLARNRLFQAYLSGNTVMNVAGLNTDTSIHVSSVSGFTDVIVPGTNVAPRTVSLTTPLPITIGVTSPISANVVGFVLDNPADPVGPGTLLLAAALGSATPARTPVTSFYAPLIVRTGGGASVDAIGASDTLLLQDCINAFSVLRNNNVPPHDDGYYHVHISPTANAQFFADPVVQRLNTALPEGVMYANGFVGHIGGGLFFMNTESPNTLNAGPRSFTGPNNAQYSPEIGAETTNDNGINIGRVIITGKGALYERYLEESSLFVTEAGLTGKQGEFDVNNEGVPILTERIRLVIRAPIDRLQQVVSATWSITNDFPVPSDVTAIASGNARFKRAVIIEHAT